MKDLITIFAYCPDKKRLEILEEFLQQIQLVRQKYDILLVSHSPIPQILQEKTDYYYYDSNNQLLEDYKYRNKFWFRSESFTINSVLVYPPSTHLAIYRLLYYTFNFANFMGYKKIHCLEYDINLNNLDLIDNVNQDLEKVDSVMFRAEDGWVYGTYFAFNLNNFDEERFKFNPEKILDALQNSDSKMTETITPVLLTHNNRSIKYRTLEDLDPRSVYQKNDEHQNTELNWCVPVYDSNSNKLYFFIYNEKGLEYTVNVIYSDKNLCFVNSQKGIWTLQELGDINEIEDVLILVNKKIKHHVKFTFENMDSFKTNNKIIFKDSE